MLSALWAQNSGLRLNLLAVKYMSITLQTDRQTYTHTHTHTHTNTDTHTKMHRMILRGENSKIVDLL